MAAVSAKSRAQSQIYAVLAAGAGAAEKLAALLAAHPLPSLLIEPSSPGSELTAALARPLVEVAQRWGCAALLLDAPELARILRADGVHLSPGPHQLDRYHEARASLGSGAIIGADVGLSRHTAMALGEAGADYVGFSRNAVATTAVAEPADLTDDAADISIDVGLNSREDLIGWWSTLFEIPCVGVDPSDDADRAAMATLGADFVMLRLPHGEAIADSLSAVSAACAAVEIAHAG